MGRTALVLVVPLVLTAFCLETAAATASAETTTSSAAAAGAGGTTARTAGVADAAEERRRKKRARLKATWRRVGRGKVAVKVRSNARKARISYRVGRKKRTRSVVVRLRKNRAHRALPKKSKRIRVRALATRRLRASRLERAKHLRAPRIWMADGDGDGIKDYNIDRQADGRRDAILFDDNRNGLYERIAIFARRKPIAVALDQDENGYLEAFLLDLDANGAGERMYYDANQDRYAEWQCLDTDGDGYADTWYYTPANVTSTAVGRRANDLMVRNISTLNQLRQLDPWSLGYLPYDPSPSLLRGE